MQLAVASWKGRNQKEECKMYEGKQGAKRLIEALTSAMCIKPTLYELAEVLYYDVDQLREDIKALENEMV